MNLNSHVKSDKAKWIVTTIILVLIIAIIGGLCYSVITGIAPQDWGKEEESSSTPVTDGDGNELTADVNPMPSTMIFSTDASYSSTSGVPDGYRVRVQATVGELYVEDGDIRWYVEWKNPDSEWAKDKDVTDYIFLSSEIGLGTNCDNICTVICSQAFGETIILNAQLVNHPYIPPAQCELGYRQRVIGYDIVFFEGEMGGGEIDAVVPTDATTITPSKVTNLNSEDMYLFEYLGISEHYSTTPLALSAPSINAQISPKFDLYTIEDDTIQTSLMGVVKNPFLNTLGMSETIRHTGFSFTQKLYKLYMKGAEPVLVSDKLLFDYSSPSSGTPEVLNKYVNSEYAYLSGVKACWDNNEGVWSYTVTSTSDYSTFTYKFDVNYTKDTYESVYWSLEAPNAISIPSSETI